MTRILTQEALNKLSGLGQATTITSQDAINRLAGTVGLTKQDAWNVYATTKGLTAQEAANQALGASGNYSVNFSVAINNGAAWNTVGGKVFTSANGLATASWKKIFYSFTCPASTAINLHLGANSETSLDTTPQTAGTVFLWGVKLEKSVNPL